MAQIHPTAQATGTEDACSPPVPVQPAAKAAPGKRRPPPCSCLVNMVNPRFHNYDKPLTVALIVGGLTSLIVVVLIVVQVATTLFEVETTSTVVDYPQFYGSYAGQRRWYEKLVSNTESTGASEGSAETSVHVDLCLELIQVLVPENDGIASKSMKFWRNVAGSEAAGGPLGVGYLENCWPPEGFLLGQELDLSQEPAPWNGQGDTNKAMSLCPGIDAAYRVGYMECSSRNNVGVCTAMYKVELDGGDAIRAAAAQPPGDISYVTCPPTTNANGAIPWVAEYKMTTTTTTKIKPTIGDAIGTALAYSAYAEILFTLVIVNMMVACKCLKQGVKVVPDWYSDA